MKYKNDMFKGLKSPRRVAFEDEAAVHNLKALKDMTTRLNDKTVIVVQGGSRQSKGALLIAGIDYYSPS